VVVAIAYCSCFALERFFVLLLLPHKWAALMGGILSMDAIAGVHGE